MVRRVLKTPPHAPPRSPALSAAPRRPRARTNDETARPISRTLLTLGLLFSLAASACGRTEWDVGDGIGDADAAIDVDYRRELVLADESVVLVELIAPAEDMARTQLDTLHDGVTLEQVIASVVPSGEPEVIYDTTTALPCMHVFADGELRGLIWL